MTPAAVILTVALLATPSPEPVRGWASWYHAPTGTAAAGPALRRALGRGWRGTVVKACRDGRCVRVRLTDWCQCYRGTSRERLIDLSSGSFARLAWLGRGVVRVRVVLP